MNDYKKKKLEKIAKEIQRCKICKEKKSGKAVPGEGNADADIVFLGEAPGRQEALTGRPFVGRSGQLLRKMIREVGLKEKDIFITSPVKYLPDRGTPTRKDIAHGKIHLEKQLDVIQPKIIVLLGNTAACAIFDKPFQTLKEHGKIVEKDNRKYLITLHPAAILRFPKYKDMVEEDFRKLKNLIKK